jgi:hypothetical protein
MSNKLQTCVQAKKIDAIAGGDLVVGGYDKLYGVG